MDKNRFLLTYKVKGKTYEMGFKTKKEGLDYYEIVDEDCDFKGLLDKVNGKYIVSYEKPKSQAERLREMGKLPAAYKRNKTYYDLLPS